MSPTPSKSSMLWCVENKRCNVYNVFLTHVRSVFKAKGFVSYSHMQRTIWNMRPLKLPLLAFHLELRSNSTAAQNIKIIWKKIWVKTKSQSFPDDERRMKKRNPKAVLIPDSQEAHSEKWTLKMIWSKSDPQFLHRDWKKAATQLMLVSQEAHSKKRACNYLECTLQASHNKARAWIVIWGVSLMHYKVAFKASIAG